LIIETYFAQLCQLVEGCAFVQSQTLTLDKRNAYRGLIKGQITFQDLTTLHFRECIELGSASPRLSYSYHYMDASQQILFRYDDTAHPNLLHLANYPHHKHAGSEETILPSSPPDLPTVLQEILTLLKPAQA
jgi:hypothetical protein